MLINDCSSDREQSELRDETATFHSRNLFFPIPPIACFLFVFLSNLMSHYNGNVTASMSGFSRVIPEKWSPSQFTRRVENWPDLKTDESDSA